MDNKITFPASLAFREPESRSNQWYSQRETRGFDDTEIWNLDVTFARLMLPRLVAWKEIHLPRMVATEQ